jgi:hypothetical protein
MATFRDRGVLDAPAIPPAETKIKANSVNQLSFAEDEDTGESKAMGVKMKPRADGLPGSIWWDGPAG